MPATATTPVPGQVGRSQPQTTVEPYVENAPFVRYSQPGRKQMYASPGNAFAALVQQPLISTPGYHARLRVRVAASGGANSTSGNTTAVTADAPFNAVQFLQFKDAFSTTLLSGDGYSILYQVPKWSGGYGLLNAADIKNMPTYSAPALSTTSSGTGNFTFATAIPLEFTKAYGLIAGANASIVPNLQVQLAPSATVYSTAPTTLPTVEVDVDTDMYFLPQGVDIAPPGLGTTRQWVVQQCYPSIGGSSQAIVNIPKLGGFVDTIIFILRDSNNARQDAYPSRLQLIIDGTVYWDTRFDEMQDDIYNAFGGITRDTGILVFSRKASYSQLVLGLFDTLEQTLSTSPGTSVQIQGAAWGSAGTPPYTLYAVVGQIVPSQTLIQGLPEE